MEFYTFLPWFSVFFSNIDRTVCNPLVDIGGADRPAIPRKLGDDLELECLMASPRKARADLALVQPHTRPVGTCRHEHPDNGKREVRRS